MSNSRGLEPRSQHAVDIPACAARMHLKLHVTVDSARITARFAYEMSMSRHISIQVLGAVLNADTRCEPALSPAVVTQYHQ